MKTRLRPVRLASPVLLAAAGMVWAGPAWTQNASFEVSPRMVVLNEDDPAIPSRSVEVALATAPTSTVTASVTWEGSAVVVSPTSLTFTTSDWETEQTLTVTTPSDADNLDPPPIEVTVSESGGTVASLSFDVFVFDDEATLVTSTGEGVPVAPGNPGNTGGDDDPFQEFETSREGGRFVVESVSLVLAAAASTGGVATNVSLYPEKFEPPGRPDFDDSAGIEALGSIADTSLRDDGLPSVYTVTPSRRVEISQYTAYLIGLSADGTLADDAGVRAVCANRTTNFGLSGWSVAAGAIEGGDGVSFKDRCRMGIRVRGYRSGPGLLLSAPAVAVNEGGTSSFSVRLDRPPGQAVTLTVASADRGVATMSVNSLVFTDLNWSGARNVTVTGVRDSDEDDDTVQVALFGTGLASSVLTVTVRDDDGPGYSFSPPFVTVDEGSAGMYTVALRTQPSAEVTVALASGDEGAVTVSPPSLTFTTADWATGRTVTVTGAPDDDASNESVAVSATASGSDSDYTDLGAVNLTATVYDDDELTIVFTETSYTVAEDAGKLVVEMEIVDLAGARTSLGRELEVHAAPLPLSRPDSRNEASENRDFDPTHLDFVLEPTETHWTGEVRIVADNLLEYDEFFKMWFHFPRVPPAVNSNRVVLGEDAPVTILDADEAVVDVDKVAYEVTEGDAVDIVVSLSKRTQHGFLLTLSLSANLAGQAEFVVTDSATQTLNSATQLTLAVPDGAQGALPAVRVRAVADGVRESDAAGSLSVQTSDPAPRGLASGSKLGGDGVVDLTVKQSPNAAPFGRPSVAGATTLGRTLTARKGTVSDGDGLPADDADLDWQWVRADDAAGTGAADIGSATSTTYTLAAADEGKYIAVKMSYTDGAGYEEELKSDARGPVGTVGFDFSASSLTVDEGRGATFAVALSTEPSASVRVAVRSGDTGAATLSPASLTFTTLNWNTARTVTAAGVQDQDSSNEEVEVSLAASGGGYGSVTGTVTVTVEDDEVPGLVLAPTAVGVREDGTRRYTARLTVQPSATVTVAVGSGDTGAATVSPSSLTFTTGNWSVAQTVTVEGVEDDDLDHETAAVTHAASGSSDYASVSETLTVTVEDDDLLEVALEEFLVVDEGRSAELEVRLVSRPSSPVTVVVDTRDAALNVSPSALAFPPADWDTYQTLTFTAAEDGDASDFTRTVTFSGGGVTQALTVAVHDDEATLVSSFAERMRAVLLTPVRASDFDSERGFQGFTTGPHTRGYTLRSVSLALYADGVTSDVVVKLLPATGTGDPDLAAAGWTLGTIAADRQVSLRVGLHELRFPAVRLNAETTYFVGISNPGAPDGSSSQVDCAAGGSETGFAGWSVADNAVRDVDGTLSAVPGCVMRLRLGGGEWSPPPPPGGGSAPPPEPEPPDPGVAPPSGPLRAAFDVEGSVCAAGLCRALTGSPVRFVDASTGPAGSWRWSFGDGASSSLRNPAYSWSVPGFYDVSVSVLGGGRESSARRTFLVEAAAAQGTCVADDSTRCLLDSRFSVVVEWWASSADSGAGRVVRKGTNDSGLFTFFDRGNWEVLIKVLDGCALNGRVWVYGATTTDLGYVIRVTDTATGEAREYRNEPGRPAPAITDVAAFENACRHRTDGAPLPTVEGGEERFAP